MLEMGDVAIVTEDWSYTSPVYGDTHHGKKGDTFTVGIYIDAKHSDSGFAFYRGDWTVNGQPREYICPAEYCEKLT